MAELIGQKKIAEKLDNITLDSLPKTLMLIGPDGSGKHLIAKMIADKFSLEYIEISEKVDRTELIEYNQAAQPRLFVIDLNFFNEKQQNQLLKFIEEPPTYSYVVVLAESTVGLLETVINRCIKWQLEPYTKQEIIDITHTILRDDLIFDLVKTPGQLKHISETIIAACSKLCNSIIKNIGRATYADTISLSTRINYKEDYDKPEFDLFLNMLELFAYRDFVATNSEQSFKIYKVVNEYKQRLIIKTIAKEPFMINMLTNLWKETR